MLGISHEINFFEIKCFFPRFEKVMGAVAKSRTPNCKETKSPNFQTFYSDPWSGAPRCPYETSKLCKRCISQIWPKDV